MSWPDQKYVKYSFTKIKNIDFQNGINANAISIGFSAGYTNQKTNAIAIGHEAGKTAQEQYTIAIGYQAGMNAQGTSAIAIGYETGCINQNNIAIAIGCQAGNNNQGTGAIAIGYQAGMTAQGQYTIAIGDQAGLTTQGTEAIAIGDQAGFVAQGTEAIAIGYQAGIETQGISAIAIGYLAGMNSQGQYTIAIGDQAGLNGQLSDAVAIGRLAGEESQWNKAIAIGIEAGRINQYSGAIAIGSSSGRNNQGTNAIAIGGSVRDFASGYNSQGTRSIAIGLGAGQNAQGQNAIAIGTDAGKNDQGPQTIAIGYDAGRVGQRTNAIAIGYQAGYNGQGTNAIAIGYAAGTNDQPNNSIIINASGSAVSPTFANATYIAPIRNLDNKYIFGLENRLIYNNSTNEITYKGDNGINIESNGTGTGIINQFNTGSYISFSGDSYFELINGGFPSNHKIAFIVNVKTTKTISGVIAADSVSIFEFVFNRWDNDGIVICRGMLHIYNDRLFNYTYTPTVLSKFLLQNTMNNNISNYYVLDTNFAPYQRWYWVNDSEFNVNGTNGTNGYILPKSDGFYIFFCSDIYDPKWSGYVRCLDASATISAGLGWEMSLLGDTDTRLYQWSALGGGLSGTCYAIAISRDNRIYVGGNFNYAYDSANNGSSVSVYNIASYSYSTISMSWQWYGLQGGLNGNCFAIAIDSNNIVYAGGDFTTAGKDNAAVTANRIAKWVESTASWSALQGGLSDTCRAIAIDSNNNVYAGGNFVYAYNSANNGSSVRVSSIAKWGGSSWSALKGGLSAICRAIAIDSNNIVYAGGNFSLAYNGANDYSPISVSCIAKWNGSSWSSLDIGLNRTCEAIAIDSLNNIYAGGSLSFDKIKRISKWGGSEWSALGGGLNSTCNAIAINKNDTVYAGGLFTSALDPSITVNYLAKHSYQRSEWSDLSGGLSSATDVTGTTCNAIAIDSNNNVYVGGEFTTAGGISANRIARFGV